MFSLTSAWINGWINNREASDFRRHCTHCDVTVLFHHVYDRNLYGGEDTPPLYKPCLLHTEAKWSICVMKPGQNWFSCSTPSRYLNQCRLIVNRTLGNKFQWHLIEVLTFSWQKIHLKTSAQFYPFGLGLSEIENFAYRELDERSFSNSHPMAGTSNYIIQYLWDDTTLMISSRSYG